MFIHVEASPSRASGNRGLDGSPFPESFRPRSVGRKWIRHPSWEMGEGESGRVLLSKAI